MQMRYPKARHVHHSTISCNLLPKKLIADWWRPNFAVNRARREAAGTGSDVEKAPGNLHYDNGFVVKEAIDKVFDDKNFNVTEASGEVLNDKNFNIREASEEVSEKDIVLFEPHV